MRSFRHQDPNFPVSSPCRSHTVISMSIQVIISNLFCTFLYLPTSLLMKDRKYSCTDLLNGCGFIEVHRCEFFQLYTYAEIKVPPPCLCAVKSQMFSRNHGLRVCGQHRSFILHTPYPPPIILFSRYEPTDHRA